MHVFASFENAKREISALPLCQGSCVCVGNFDGVHLGHQALFALAKQHAAGRPVVALTFDPHPACVVTNALLQQLVDTDTKSQLLAKAGADHVVVLSFTPEMAALSPEQFVEYVLVDALQSQVLIAGYDFTLGKNQAGTLDYLRQLGEKCGFCVHKLPPFVLDNAAVSSTRIRKAIEQGKVFEAARLLGRYHSVRGTVLHGQKRGQALLNTPTANLSATKLLLPKPGVYATFCRIIPQGAPANIDKKTCAGEQAPVFKAVTNVGYNPTFNLGSLSVESHLLDFQGDIYEHGLEVFFVQRLRDEQRFANIQELMDQIKQDTASARALLQTAPLTLSSPRTP